MTAAPPLDPWYFPRQSSRIFAAIPRQTEWGWVSGALYWHETYELIAPFRVPVRPRATKLHVPWDMPLPDIDYNIGTAGIGSPSSRIYKHLIFYVMGVLERDLAALDSSAAGPAARAR